MTWVLRWLSTAAGLLLQFLGVLLAGFTVGRGVYYPFWAARATHTELATSCGGPSAVGATLVHWAVGVVAIAVAALLFLGGRSLQRSPRRQAVRG